MTDPDVVVFECLGGCELIVGGVQRPLPTRRSAALLAYLACKRRSVARSTLASIFWPDRDEGAAHGNLRVVLSNLRRQVPDLLSITRESVAWHAAARDTVDVRRFDDAATVGLARQGARSDWIAALHASADAYGGDLLAGFNLDVGEEFDEWLSTERSRLKVRAAHVLEALIDADLESTVSPRTRELAERLIAIDGLSEGAMSRLMCVMAATGDRAGAIDRYDEWARELRARFGLRPTDELATLAVSIAHERTTTNASIGQAPLPPRPTLFGRDDDAERISDLLAAPGRVVTISGRGGVGKTGLAIEVAHRERALAGRDVGYVNLDAVHTESEFIAAIVQATGEAGSPPADPAGLVRLLARRDLLLVLDNFEHLPARRPTVALLAKRCEKVGILVTSRCPLHLSCEHVYRLGGLDVPDHADGDADQILEASAVALFFSCADRGGTVLPRDLATATLIAQICDRLDGAPYAIELAAAQLPVLGLRRLSEALASEDWSWWLDVLGRGSSDSHRHRSARQVADTSYSLLSPPARSLFRRLAALPPTFDLDAILATCLGDDVTRRNVLELVAELVDLHLVVRFEGLEGGGYCLPTTLRAYAGELLGVEGRLDKRATRQPLNVAPVTLEGGAGS